MIKKLRRKLTLLFSFATGIILTLVLAITFLYQRTIMEARHDASFQNQLLDLANKLEIDTEISDTWLARIEADSRLIIHIEENGIPLFFSGAWNPPTDRTRLIESAKHEAMKQNVNPDVRPLFSSLQKTEPFTVPGDHHDTYTAVVLVTSVKNGFRSLTILHDTTSIRHSLRNQAFLFLALDLAGIIALGLVSRYVVGRSLKPVAESHKKQTEFVAAASHELRSPLAVIQASASAIETLPQQGPKMASIIHSECVRAGNLVRDLLMLASCDSGTLDKTLEHVEADLVLLRLYESYEPLCRKKEIHLKISLPDELLPPVLAKEDYLYQILSILLENAMAYGCPADTEEGKWPEILLSAQLVGKKLILSVTDHGSGISDEEKERIFDRFYRSDTSRSQKEHFGLGLSIAATLAAQMNTTLWVRDTEGGGTTFQLSLTAIRIPPQRAGESG